jgi:DNA-binding MarR family transcriptional regulator
MKEPTKTKTVTRQTPSKPREESGVPNLPLERSVGYQIRMTHRLAQRALQARIEKRGVTVGMWYFLRALWERDGMTQSELSNCVGTMEPTTLSAVALMEKAGIVVRVRNKVDKRKINIFLSKKGHALRKELLPEAISVVEAAVRSLSDREVDLLLALLSVVQTNLAAELGEGLPLGTKPRQPPRP